MFLVLRNVDSPLGRFLKGGANAAKNFYSFGFGKVRCYAEWLSNYISTVFQSHILHSNYPTCLFLIFSTFLFSKEVPSNP